MHLLELVAALGAVQGLLLLVLVAVRFRSRINVPFALFLLTFSVRLGTIPSWTPEALLSARWLLPVAGAVPLLFGPLILWYVRELVRNQQRFPRYAWLHVLPWLAETAVLGVWIAMMDDASYLRLVHAVFTPPAPWWLPVRHAVKGVLGGAYAVAAARIAFGPESREPHITRPRRLWVRAVVALPLLCLVSFAVVAIQPTSSAGGALLRFSIPAAVMASTVYAFALLVLAAPDVLTAADRRQANRVSGGLDEEELLGLADGVRRCMESGVYRDPSLTITGLAKQLGLHPNRLSSVINQGFGRNFSQLVHDHRLAYFIARVQAGDLERFTILSLAFEAGFSSKSTFHRVFRDRFGAAPSDYLREHAQVIPG